VEHELVDRMISPVARDAADRDDGPAHKSTLSVCLLLTG
jgi:hypothetical protein